MRRVTIMTETWAYIQLAKPDGPDEVTIRPRGHSMEPIIMDRQEVTIAKLKDTDTLNVGDVVIARVRGHVYLHKVTAVDGDRVQISNNHGYVNGWTSRPRVVGRVNLGGYRRTGGGIIPDPWHITIFSPSHRRCIFIFPPRLVLRSLRQTGQIL